MKVWNAGEKVLHPDLNQNFLGEVPGDNSGKFYADQDATVRRFADRFFVGAAADNQAKANRDVAPRDWLSNVMGATSVGAWATWGAQSAALARYGTIGHLSASRTSDAKGNAAMLGYTPASIGSAFWAVADDTSNPTETTGWAFYAEAWRMPGVSYKPTFGGEIEVVNFGGLPVGLSTPYQINVGGGTYGLQFGAGGGQTVGTYDGSAVFTVVRNPNGFQKGMVFKANAIAGTDGTIGNAGFAPVLTMGRGQGLEWYDPAGNAGPVLRSLVTDYTKGAHVEWQDNSFLVTNAIGQQVFSMYVDTSGVLNSLYTRAGTASQPPALHVGDVGGALPHLDLCPASGGLVRILNGLRFLSVPPSYASDAAAASGGLSVGDPYLNSSASYSLTVRRT